MIKKFFTKKEIDILSSNSYVKSVSTKGITYTDEFKQIFIAQSNNSKSSREIFEECGFDIIGMDRVCSAENNLLKPRANC
jgi:transposase